MGSERGSTECGLNMREVILCNITQTVKLESKLSLSCQWIILHYIIMTYQKLHFIFQSKPFMPFGSLLDLCETACMYNYSQSLPGSNLWNGQWWTIFQWVSLQWKGSSKHSANLTELIQNQCTKIHCVPLH